jgi:N-formylmaleamate deformylase
MQATSQHVDVDGVRLHVTRAGDADAPPLVLSHGITDDGPCWTEVAEAFAATHEVVMVDARGHGRSEAPVGGYGPDEHAADLLGVVRVLGLRDPVLLGHSMGASTSLLAAARRPEVPRAIVLEDPPPSWAWSERPAEDERARVAEMRARFREMKRLTAAELAAEQRAAAPTWSEAEVARWVDAKQRFDLAAGGYVDATDAVDWAAVLSDVRCPVLLVTGDQEAGALVGPDETEQLRTLVPQLQVAHVPDAGHSIRHDHLERYLDAVRRFLAAVAR